ncbi:MAG: WG repeat-containing protein [Bacteroidetes bacterium]|nr:WG repeat-containing protein [Bacteroidota bacterium]
MKFKFNIQGSLFIFLFIFCLSKLSASKLENGFKALSIYDYFKAKKLFAANFKSKNDPYSSYGMAVIYSRNDNPFFNLDSASKYISLSYNLFFIKNQSKVFFQFKIDGVHILQLVDSVAAKGFEKLKKEISINKCNSFLKQNYLANKNLLNEVVYLRDELEYNETVNYNDSRQTKEFVITHPQSAFVQEALLLIDRQIFDESTKDNTDRAYISFIKINPKNILLNSAYEKLFSIYKQNSDVAGLKTFVSNYPKAPQNLEAWKLLFALTVKSFSNSELEKFLEENPNFPLKNSILKELELNNLVLYPYQKEDLFGFVDASAKIIIQPVFDAVSGFSEGLSVVSRNDSVFFINKEDTNPFDQYFVDAYSFNNGIAPVKYGKQWSFINRQGQIISQVYDEINEISDNFYTVKLNGKFGALNNFGQVILEPKFEELGDFKNGFAYYRSENKSGFVSKEGYVHKPEFDWLSDFSTDKIAIVKIGNSYGLINAGGKIILDTKYDQVIKANNGIYIVVLNNLYGFYNSYGCFLSAVAYDFAKEKPADFYTNGQVFKLVKKNQQALMDVNGRTSIDFGVYDEINFASNGLIRVKNKNKYGFVDRKLNLVIPYKYSKASDFKDSCALVQLKDKFFLINLKGKEIYSSIAEIQKISPHYYLVHNESELLVNFKGELVFSDISNIQPINSKILLITLNNGSIKLLHD